MKKVLCIIFTLLFSIGGVFSLYAYSVEYAIGVTDEMCNPEFWKERTNTDCNELLMTDDEILAVNQAGIDGKGTYIFDIEHIDNINGYQQAQNLNPAPPAGKEFYIRGEKVDLASYYKKINDAIHTTGYTETSMEPEYAVTVRICNMRDIPTKDVLGYTASDPDDQMLLESLTVNEPFLIRAKCTIDGTMFYYGYSLNCTGWICGDDLAICKDKAEWLDAWKCDIDGEDFIVVTTDKIVLDKTYLCPNASELMLRIGTTLKLVPENEMPEIIGERGIWNNYIVYIPVRNADGSYSKEAAMISQHCKVNVGYLDFTQANILDVAFECLGNTFGWAGWLDSFDSSLYMAAVYRCFGLNIPRNGQWQRKVPGTAYSLAGMSDEEKMKFIETMPAGTMLFFDGHVMMYLGKENDTGYVISSLGKVAESEGEKIVKSIYGICITPLTVRRNASYGYTTWLHNMVCVVCCSPRIDIAKCYASAETKCTDSELADYALTVQHGTKTLYEGINYTVSQSGNKLTINGTGYFEGSQVIEIESRHNDLNCDDICDNCKGYVSGNFFTHLLFCIKKAIKNIINVFIHCCNFKCQKALCIFFNQCHNG